MEEDGPFVVNLDAETSDVEKDRRWLEGELERGGGAETAEAAMGMETEAEVEEGAALIIANCPRALFERAEMRAELENLLKQSDSELWLEYFPSFRRLRAHFRSAEAAASAKLHLDQLLFHGHSIRLYMAQTVPVADAGRAFLAPPPLEKQFLISPPASPPVGWEQSVEDAPVINHDLIHRLALLSASRDAPPDPETAIRTELVPATPNTPSIVVHTAPASPALNASLHSSTEDEKENFPRPPKLPRTPRPPHSHSQP